MPKAVFHTRDQNGKAERVETAIREYEVFFERRQDFAVLSRHLLHLLHYS